ncbi:MAG: PilZ domain-containing protein [Candidatus Hydrogenedentes bacterium]|nr:PilZ domain-containing protein [Candidatus Hydrogenedentota bacterium]
MNQTLATRERRSAKRVAFSTPVRYQLSREFGGHASLVDIDQGGICIALSHAVSVGQRLMLDVIVPKAGDRAIELKGRVAWCEQTADGYRAGIRVYHDEETVRVALCTLMCAALKKQAAVADIRNRHFIYVEWKLAALDANEEPGKILRKRDRVKHAVRNVLALGY